MSNLVCFGQDPWLKADNTMKGLVFLGDRKIALMDFPDPSPQPGEVVLEIRASGMCGTDLKYYRGSADVASTLGLSAAAGPTIAGHEPCGVVVAVGGGVPKTQAWIGMRAMQHHYRGCFACPQCMSGWTQLCDQGVDEIYGVSGHGAHAKFFRCPARTLVELPEPLSFESGAAISCGTGTAWGALQRLEARGIHTIAVFGQGPVGLSTTMLASAMGATVIAIDVNDERLERATKFGAQHIINPLRLDPISAVRSLTRGKGADLSIEASSSATAREQAVRCLRTWGKACFVGEGGDVTLNVSSDLLRRQISLLGSWTFSLSEQRHCAEFVARHALDLDRLFTDRWRLDEGGQAYAHFDRQSAGKGVICP
jgi:threonine dehydrogenase-like Zn-dependent dehydrogenase